MDIETLRRLDRLDLWGVAMRHPPYDRLPEETAMLALKIYAQKYAKREETRNYYGELPDTIIAAIDDNGKVIGDGDINIKIRMFENLVLYE